MTYSGNKKIKYIKQVKRPVVRPCPCAAGHVSCDYVVVSHILGCPFDCSYCFLHTFYGQDEIAVYDNNDDVVAQVLSYFGSAGKPLRVGTGQYSDSLALDEKTGLARRLIELFAGQDEHLFELKTKSAAVDHLLDLKHDRRTVFAWSVNPQKIAESDELGAVSLAERLSAARKCARAGYPVAFHFDPVINYPGWEKDYQEVVDLIFAGLEGRDIAWISLGALRFHPELQAIIKERFPGSRISCDLLEKGADNKMRYSEPLRAAMFKQMLGFIRERSKDLLVYLCMESEAVWQAVDIRNSGSNPYYKYFKFFIK